MASLKPADAFHAIEESQKSWNSLEDKRTDLIHLLDEEFKHSTETATCGEVKVLVPKKERVD